jgi:hypothetical protein
MVRRSTYKKRYYKPSRTAGDTLYKKSNRKIGDPYKKRKSTRKVAARRTVRAPVRRKVAGRKPRCRVHKICIKLGTRKVRAVMNCKGKVHLTKQGRKTFNVAKKNCRCKRNAQFGAKRTGKSCPVRRRKSRR